MEATIKDAKKFLRENYYDGCECPACGQHVQLYDYKLFATSAVALMRLYNLGDGFHHISKFAEANDNYGRAPHFAELRFWGLVEKMPNDDPNKKSSGFWRITDKGKQFADGIIKVQSRILVYNNTFQGFSDKSEEIDIKQALGNKFDYSELMQREFEPVPRAISWLKEEDD